MISPLEAEALSYPTRVLEFLNSLYSKYLRPSIFVETKILKHTFDSKTYVYIKHFDIYSQTIANKKAHGSIFCTF